jgi:hypothetical protein
MLSTVLYWHETWYLAQERPHIEGVWGQNDKENIQTYQKECSKRVLKITERVTPYFVIVTKYH